MKCVDCHVTVPEVAGQIDQPSLRAALAVLRRRGLLASLRIGIQSATLSEIFLKF